MIVESYPVIEGNYIKIVDALRSRFCREELQIEVYVRELLRIIISNATSDKKMDVATLYDKLESHIRSLETL